MILRIRYRIVSIEVLSSQLVRAPGVLVVKTMRTPGDLPVSELFKLEFQMLPTALAIAIRWSAKSQIHVDPE